MEYEFSDIRLDNPTNVSVILATILMRRLGEISRFFPQKPRWVTATKISTKKWGIVGIGIDDFLPNCIMVFKNFLSPQNAELSDLFLPIENCKIQLKKPFERSRCYAT